MALKETTSARREAIVAAAGGVFLRYGFKKTSMENLARAAGLSRQALYLHFDAKEALFKATVLRLVEDLGAAWRAALARKDAGTEERIAAAFEALHSFALAEPDAAAHMNELLETARTLVGPAVEEVERALVAAVARLLTTSRIAAGWAKAGVSARDLAENLSAASAGLKHSAPSLAAYRKGMRTAVRIVARGSAD